MFNMLKYDKDGGKSDHYFGLFFGLIDYLLHFSNIARFSQTSD